MGEQKFPEIRKDIELFKVFYEKTKNKERIEYYYKAIYFDCQSVFCN